MASPSPLRIQKGPSTSLVKPASSIPRPLSELAPTTQRRNSPSFTKPQSQKPAFAGDSSPFQSSPFNASEGNSSPRLYWQNRETTTPNRFNAENAPIVASDSSSSPTRRSSIERLQRASRVKNSNMFAREQKQEYDPTSVPTIERPLAKQVQGNAYGGSGLEGLRSAERADSFRHQRHDSSSKIPMLTPTKSPLKPSANAMRSPSRDQISPTKSSLSSRYNPQSTFDPENATLSEEFSSDERELPPGRTLHRHAKSVTFDVAPPQVNEYERATPDASSVGTGSRENSYDSAEEEDEESFNHGDSVDQDDSFDASLEDTDKTPVVGPEDWRHASPGTHNTGIMSGKFEDPFEGPEGSPRPDARPSLSSDRPTAGRTDSLNSNGDHRPLPPLPDSPYPGRINSGSSIGGSERNSSLQRNLPSPPAPNSAAKLDSPSLKGSKMSLEERLRLMMLQDDESPNSKSLAEQQRERRMRRAGNGRGQTPERESSIPIHEDEDTFDDLPSLGVYQLPARISRESILRKVNGQDGISRDSDYNFSSPAPSSSPERATPLDPDTPIPSTEDRSVIEDENEDESVIIKQEPEEDSEVDVYSIPDMYHQKESSTEDHENGEPTTQDNIEEDNIAQDESSPALPSHGSPHIRSNSASEDDGPPTPRVEETQDQVEPDARTELPDFGGFLSTGDFGLGLSSYMTPSPEIKEVAKPRLSRLSDAHEYLTRSETPDEEVAPSAEANSLEEPTTLSTTPEKKEKKVMLSSKPEYDGTGWGSDEEDELEIGTPDSVIRHRASDSPRDSPDIPEAVATIKSSGSKLKTRPSATPSDLMSMREMRRQVSSELANIPPIPERHRNRPSLNLDLELEPNEVVSSESEMERKESFKKRSLTLDIGNELGLGLDKDFDRVIEAQKVAFDLSSISPYSIHANGQAPSTLGSLAYDHFANITPRKQRGYLMRQNTKVVVASSDVGLGTRSAGNSPVKKERPQSWTVEPWNGQIRQNSLRDKAGIRKRTPPGAIPPLPGHQSNVTTPGLTTLKEDVPNVNMAGGEGYERGRLFVKVMGVKDLDLPLPRGEQTWFSLTLDNGVHCVTTSWLELGRNAPIGQEFELIVPNELEFQLTLNVRLTKPAIKQIVESPSKKVQKQSTFSRVFTSPKKRKELESRQKEEDQRLAQQKQRDAQAKRASVQPTAWDLLSPLTADDGSFGRAYVSLKEHEARCYGRPYIVDVACFNEWATESPEYSSSVKSKRGQTTVMRRAPYKVGKLELQLLFVPKPVGASDDDMPKSMNACIREMREAELALARSWEGHLSQQGGDCPYWRRRYFKLQGSKLTAYHETTRQPRAAMYMANACKLIDDRRALTQTETSGKGGKRRKSGFAEEEEGYMFVEEGFRIRFNNGEVIDFYADTAADKEGWMKVLDACIGKDSDGLKGGWRHMVLKHEEAQKKQAEQNQVAAGKRHHSRTKSTNF